MDIPDHTQLKVVVSDVLTLREIYSEHKPKYLQNEPNKLVLGVVAKTVVPLDI